MSTVDRAYSLLERDENKHRALLLYLSLDFDSYDAWDSCMIWLFSIAAEMYWRGIGPPTSWRYRPSPCRDDPREDDPYAEVCEGASDAELHYAGEVLMRYRDLLIHQGRDY